MSASRTSTTLTSAARSSSALSAAARSSSALAAAACSSALMRRVDADFQSQLAYKSSPLALYGIALLCVGLALIAAGLRMTAAQSVMLFELSAGVVAFGALALLLVQLGVTIDCKLRRIVVWRWLGMQRPCAVYNLSPFDFITISREGYGARARFEVCLNDSNSNFRVARFPSELKAHEFAGEVAHFLNVRVVDCASGEWESVR